MSDVTDRPVGGNPKYTGEPPTHGTIHAYINFGCRCATCVRAWSVYGRQRRDSIKVLQERILELEGESGHTLIPMAGTPVLLRRNWDGTFQVGTLNPDHSWVMDFVEWKDA